MSRVEEVATDAAAAIVAKLIVGRRTKTSRAMSPPHAKGAVESL
jgi:hypothetical protein